MFGLLDLAQLEYFKHTRVLAISAFVDNLKTQCILHKMAAHAPRLARLFSPAFARAINAQIVNPASAQVVKPNELESALARPLQKAYYQPNSSVAELAASLSYGIIKGHPFLDGNKRTAFFLANEYVRAQGLPGLADGGKVGEAYKDVQDLAERHIGVASGQLDASALSHMKA